MAKMTDTEFRIVMAVTRATLGWEIDPVTKMRKKEDWLSYYQLKKITGRGYMSLSKAISSCIKKGWIEARDKDGNLLDTKNKRIGKKIYYRLGKEILLKNDGEEIVVKESQPLQKVERSNSTSPKSVITKSVITKSRAYKRKTIQKKNYTKDLVEIQRIYDFFISSFKKNTNQYKLTPLRRQKIKKRLEDAGEEMLKRAIANTAASPFHRGKNDHGWQADLDFIIRSYEQVEKLANMQVPKKEEEKLDLTRSSANPLYRQWLIEGAKEDFEDWVKKRY